MPFRRPCPTGKVQHADEDAARRHMAALIRKDGSTRLNVYRCPACPAWHVGHKRGLARDIANAVRAGNRAAAQARRPRRR